MKEDPEVKHDEVDSKVSYGVFAERIAAERLKRSPVVRLRNGWAEIVLTDIDGQEVSFARGASVSGRTFANFELAGLHFDDLVLEEVTFRACGLANAEFRGCRFTGCRFTGGTPGFVVNESQVSSFCVENANDGILRFVRSEISGLVISDSRISLELNRCKGKAIAIQRTEIVAPSRVIKSEINGLRVVDASFAEMLVAQSSFWAAEFFQSKWVATVWIEVKIECAQISEIEFDKSLLQRVSFDGSTIRRMKISACFADLSLRFASVMSWEAVATYSRVLAEHTTFDGFAWWKSRLGISIKNAAMRSLRFCDGELIVISGADTTIHSPVIRRSYVHSYETKSIEVCEADISSSNNITSSATVWLNPNGGGV